MLSAGLPGIYRKINLLNGSKYDSCLVRSGSGYVMKRMDLGFPIGHGQVRSQSGIVNVDEHKSYKTPRSSEKLLWRLVKLFPLNRIENSQLFRFHINIYIKCLTYLEKR